uniref:Uncharacterized protein n=1 Tax=Eutreptiella gymnastica TaxID=73025 RepID=A0A7S1N7W4_9EUGL|mmetsp:Transcript_135107/g.234245  ORF Transcript_135107/g.234245 Transcript_135107/m.234245 type:complete len:558 (+) Transcript_135107:49-1722(+)
MDPNALFVFAWLWSQTQLFHTAKEWHRWSSGGSVAHVLLQLWQECGTPRPWLVAAICGLGGYIVLHGMACLLRELHMVRYPTPRALFRKWVLLCFVSLVYLALYGSYSNHIILDMFLNLSLVVAALPSVLDDAWQEGFARCMHALRLQTVTLYFLTTVYKLNTAWFDPSVSCASEVMGMVLQQYAPAVFPPTARHTQLLLTLSPYAAVATEIVLAVGLALPVVLDDGERGRLALLKRCTATVGVGMHVYLAVPLPPSSFYPFSVTMLALYVAFLPVSMGHVLQRVSGRALLVAAGAVLLPTTLLWTWLVTGAASDFYEYPPYGLYNFAVGWILVVAAWLLYALWARPASDASSLVMLSRPEETSALKWVLPWVCPAGILALGCLPFLGLRTHPNFAMFSNLRVEGCVSNHLFMPQWAAGLTEDFVHVKDTDIPGLRHFQVDLSALFYSPTLKYLSDAGMVPSLWICPPQWTKDAPFQSYYIPVSAFSRVLNAYPEHETGYVRFTLYRQCKAVTEGLLTWPMSTDERRKEWFLQPMGFWEGWVSRFRSFDLHTSTCRH